MTTTHEDNSAYFDEIAGHYEQVDTGSLLVRQYSEVHSLFNLLGDITGKSILELSCSDGFFTRKLKQKGAARVVGVDLSEKMIELGKREEAKNPLGIEYIARDVFKLGCIGSFDLVVTPFLLNYARTKEELLEMCQIIHANLKPTGRFVSMNDHPSFNPVLGCDKYEKTHSFSLPAQDEMLITITFIPHGENSESETVSFYNYYYSQATYEWALESAGFKNICWHQPDISPLGIQKFGQEFWQNFLDNPFYVFIESFK